MEKLIDLLNELAVSEAECEAIDAEMERRYQAGEDIEELEVMSDNLYIEQHAKFRAVVKRLQDTLNIGESTARAMVIKKRSDLVRIASKGASANI